MLPGIYMKLSLMTPITGNTELLYISSLPWFLENLGVNLSICLVFLPGQMSVDESTWIRSFCQSARGPDSDECLQTSGFIIYKSCHHSGRTKTCQQGCWFRFPCKKVLLRRSANCQTTLCIWTSNCALRRKLDPGFLWNLSDESSQSCNSFNSYLAYFCGCRFRSGPAQSGKRL